MRNIFWKILIIPLNMIGYIFIFLFTLKIYTISFNEISKYNICVLHHREVNMIDSIKICSNIRIDVYYLTLYIK